MIDLSEIEQYFPNVNKKLIFGNYSFVILISEDSEKDIFVVNLKIRQKDTKKNDLIKFKIGIGKDRERDSKSHKTNEPHFEVEIYKREESSFSANIYFTFSELSDDVLSKYIKGTVVLISNIIQNFIDSRSLDMNILNRLVFFKQVKEELGSYENFLMDGLYDCYKKSTMTVREKGNIFTISTPHNLSKYLDVDDLQPLYLSLLKKVKK